MDQESLSESATATLITLFSRIEFMSTCLEFDVGFRQERQMLGACCRSLQDFLIHFRPHIYLHSPEFVLNLQNVGYDAYHALDELINQFFRQKLEIEPKLQQKIKRKKICKLYMLSAYYFSSSNPRIFRRKMNNKFGDIINKLREAETGIHEQPCSFQLERFNEREWRNQIREIPDLNFVPPVSIVGRENEVAQIVETLSMRPRIDRYASVLAIIGMSGLGKTTLAQHIYNHQEIKRKFDERLWISASGEFETKRVLKLILEAVTQKPVDERYDVSSMVRDLQMEVEGKRYLFVLDNLYTGYHFPQTFLDYAFEIDSIQGNWWLITARDREDLTFNNGFSPNFHSLSLKPLEDHDCISIFRSYALTATETDSFASYTRSHIVHICRGVPLAAEILGRIVHNQPRYWLPPLKGRARDVDVDVKQILRCYLYKMPSSSIKKCLAYCSSIFPKECVIEKEQLVQLWMAGGLIDTDTGMDWEMEDMGYENFTILLNCCFLQADKVDEFGNVTHCKLHDLVHDLAQSLSSYDSLNLDDPTPTRITDIPQLRHLRLQSIEQDHSSGFFILLGKLHRIETTTTGNLSTLILESNISDELLSNFKSLHVLKLCSKDIEDLPSSISKLIHLRYLDLSGTRIKSLPPFICKLYNLETLRILKCHSLKKLPEDIANLISLRHLEYFGDEEFYMPPRMGQMTSLLTLLFYNLGQDEGSRVEELRCLEKLRGKIVIRKLESITGKREAQRANVHKKVLQKLEYQWSDNREGNANDEDVLEGMRPHSELRSLTLRNYMAESLPRWFMHIEDIVSIDIDSTEGFLNNLMELKLVNCRRLKEIPMLGQLPLLQYLEIRGLTKVTHIGSSFYGTHHSHRIGHSTTALFAALKMLTLDSMPNLIEWKEAEQAPRIEVFPCLENLTIQYCPRLTTIPSHFPAVKQFKILSPTIINENMPVASLCNVTTLVELCYSATEITCLPSALFHANRNLEILCISSSRNLTNIVPSLHDSGKTLRELSICGCEKLSELPEGIFNLPCLEILSVEECPRLRCLPDVLGSDNQLSVLRHFKMAYCDGLTHLPDGFIDSCTNMRSLRISHCPNLISCPLRLDHMAFLSSLWISKCTKWRSIPQGVEHLYCLRELQIGHFSDLVEFDAFRAVLCSLRELKALRTVGLYGLPKWTYLPLELLELQALRLLYLNGFGIEWLPDWLGEISTLEEVGLYSCKRLEHMPSEEAMKRLTKLSRLSVFDCPSVKEKCKEYYGPGSGWSGPKFQLITD